MRRFLTAVAAAATISAALTLLPALGDVGMQGAAATADPAVVADAGCGRAWPYPQCERGQLPARNVRLITTDRVAVAQ